MAPKVGLIDFGSMGNVESVYRALLAAGAQVKIVRTPEEFDGVSHYVLPGVGSFPEAMEAIQVRGLDDPIRLVAHTKPTLGICLGMQLLATLGFEFGEMSGLNLIEGEVRLMRSKAPVPHIGYNRIEVVESNPLFNAIDPSVEFYFMHSYEFVNYTDVCALSRYGGHCFVSAVNKGNLYGVQFHPEKSRLHGIRLLQNFIRL